MIKYVSSQQGSQLFIENENNEVKYLYTQYKDMAEELRMKWRIILESIQQLYEPQFSN